jgi:hypothetical protein
VGRQHELDREIEQGPETFDHLLVCDSLALPLVRVELEAPAEVGKRVADDDRTATFDPEHEIVVLPSGKRLDSERKPVTCQVEVRLAAVPGQQPAEVWAPARGLFGSDAEFLHEVLLRVGRRRETGAPSRSTGLASRSCHGAVSTITGSRSAASSSSSPGTASGSKRSSRTPSSSA